MKPQLKPIVAYYPKIAIEGGLTLKLSLPDWFTDEEVLSDLAKRFKAKTVGELVEAIKDRKSLLDGLDHRARLSFEAVEDVAMPRVEIIREAANPATSRIWGLDERVD